MENSGTGKKTTPATGGFQVAGWVDVLGGLIARHRNLWRRLGDLETKLVDGALEGVEVRRPIYVAGLARSGSTILLETLAEHPAVATHRYRDYPPVFTPYLWNRWLDLVPTREERPAERTHQDGILVTSGSPEAFEEVLWMSFFPEAHEVARNAVLDRSASHPAFEAFYRDHLKKLLAVRGAERYVAKGNYNITRLAYLQKLFPDARFLIPVRDPVWHIASLMKQQALFVKGQTGNPRARRHLARVGHFEFGLDRRPIHCGDGAATAAVARLWADGQEVEGWARYWTLIHDYLADAMEGDAVLRDACLVVRYEALCEAPRQTLQAVLGHCELVGEEAFLETAAGRLHAPGYYRPKFSEAEVEVIGRLTDRTAARFGYAPVGARTLPSAVPSAAG